MDFHAFLSPFGDFLQLSEELAAAQRISERERCDNSELETVGHHWTLRNRQEKQGKIHHFLNG